jgi:diaminohydroxyphosphoribosylaminopyrimidine deaminase/5-amino-6-(5-phosphoribosylamino)uracil reductase
MGLQLKINLLLHFLTFFRQLPELSSTSPTSTSNIPPSLCFTQQDEYFMERAIHLASLGSGKTAPNPCVGCVLVDVNGEVISEGYHKRAGSNHAEVEAILSAMASKTKSLLLEGATAYVSLEPCNHFGRTPPCSDALIR